MKKKLIIGSAILFITLLLLYSRFISTSGFIVSEKRIVSKNLPDSFYGLKIVHLSDIHFGRTVSIEKMDSIVKRINESKPDIVVITGDLLDRDTVLEDDGKVLASSLKKIKAKLGKYAITGNHDVIHSYFKDVVKNSGFTLIDDAYELIYNESTTPIILAGMSSNLEIPGQPTKKLENLNTYLDSEGSFKETFKFLIMHEPDYIDRFNYKDFNLVLAGHSHNGQVRLPIFGALILPPGAKNYYEPYYKLNNTEFYISSGLGTSTINFRFFNRPSINLYRIVNK